VWLGFDLQGQGCAGDARQEVIGFVLSNGGLMADLSFEGTKVSKLDL